MRIYEALLWFSVLWFARLRRTWQPKKDGLQTERKRQSMRTLRILSLALAIGLSAASPNLGFEVSPRQDGVISKKNFILLLDLFFRKCEVNYVNEIQCETWILKLRKISGGYL